MVEPEFFVCDRCEHRVKYEDYSQGFVNGVGYAEAKFVAWAQDLLRDERSYVEVLLLERVIVDAHRLFSQVRVD